MIVIAGPSGCGESTITKEVLNHFPKCVRLVTATTRKIRDNEKDGVDYYYFSKERFLEEESLGNILEHTYVANRDTYYGTYKPDLEKKFAEGKIVIINPDVVGAKYFKENYDALTIFILPDSLESLSKRIQNRTPDISPHELEQRLENAHQEIVNEQPFYDYTIKNEQGKLDEAVQKVLALIKEHSIAS